MNRVSSMTLHTEMSSKNKLCKEQHTVWSSTYQLGDSCWQIFSHSSSTGLPLVVVIDLLKGHYHFFLLIHFWFNTMWDIPPSVTLSTAPVQNRWGLEGWREISDEGINPRMDRKMGGGSGVGVKKRQKGRENQTRCRAWLRGHKTWAGVSLNQNPRDGNHGGEGKEGK